MVFRPNVVSFLHTPFYKNKNTSLLRFMLAQQRGHPTRPEPPSIVGILSFAKLLICYSALDRKLKIFKSLDQRSLMLAAILFILGVTVGNSWVQTINPRSLNYPLTRQQATDDEDQGDFITRVFKKFMPDPAEMGMKRMTIETAPEQYYCTKDRWADPVSGDDQIAAIFRPVLAQTNFEKRKVELAFDANRDGWSADAFHQKLDAQGPAVVFCRSKNGGVFGGYNPKGWVNYGEFRGSLAAFLFVFPDGNTDVLPLKLSKAGGAGLAQVDDGGGPKFGMEDLGIPLSERSPKMVRSKLGAYYERMPGGENSLLPGYAKVDELIELKVYTGVYEKDEYRPFTDAEPFALN